MTSPVQYTGLTWDHPRGYEPLAAAAQQLLSTDSGITIHWDKQPLEGFESHPIGELAARYDLVVLDHPCMGEVVEHDCFVPMEDLFRPDELAVWERAAVGPSFTSYHYGGHQWALPLDAATQVCALHPDLVEETRYPKTWHDVLVLADKVPMCLSLAGPHALLGFFSICAGLAGDGAQSGQDRMFSRAVCIEAFDLLAALHARAIRSYDDANPITILDAMSATRDIAFCPLIYGYVNYAMTDQGEGQRPLVFVNAPRPTAAHRARSTVGGTGLAISRRARISSGLLDHVRTLMSDAYQVDFSPAHAGQPGFESAWRNEGVDGRAGHFYSNTIESITNGWVRPRYSGYVAFQGKGSAFLRGALAQGMKAAAVADQLGRMFDQSHTDLEHQS